MYSFMSHSVLSTDVDSLAPPFSARRTAARTFVDPRSTEPSGIAGSDESMLGIVTGEEGILLRKGPGLEYRVSGALNYLTEIRVQDKSANWFQIVSDGQLGYVRADQVRLLDLAFPDVTGVSHRNIPAKWPQANDRGTAVRAKVSSPAVDRKSVERRRVAEQEKQARWPGAVQVASGTPPVNAAAASIHRKTADRLISDAFHHSETLYQAATSKLTVTIQFTTWLHRVLLAIGVVGLLCAAASALLGLLANTWLLLGIGMVSVAISMYRHPQKELERHLRQLTLLGVIYGTYWAQLPHSIHKGDPKELEQISQEALRDLQLLARMENKN